MKFGYDMLEKFYLVCVLFSFSFCKQEGVINLV